MASSFERDFGYLLPFLDRVTQAASDHPDARVRAELLSLLSEERARWSRVRELLRAGPGRARADALGVASGEASEQTGRRKASSGASPIRSVPGDRPDAPGRPPPTKGATYTVGPLRSGD